MDEEDRLSKQINIYLPKSSNINWVKSSISTEGKPDVISNKRKLRQWIQQYYEKKTIKDLEKLHLRSTENTGNGPSVIDVKEHQMKVLDQTDLLGLTIQLHPIHHHHSPLVVLRLPQTERQNLTWSTLLCP